MVTLDDFSIWMKDNTALSDSSVYKYTRAVNTISNEMNENKEIAGSLKKETEIFVKL